MSELTANRSEAAESASRADAALQAEATPEPATAQ